jgi:hypothetical protein
MKQMASIVIVGGGTAGWLAACYLQRTLGSDSANPLRITLVESHEIGVIGVGEATVPTLRLTMQALGLAEGVLFAEADATLKNGIRFIGWRQGRSAAEDRYDHPFDIPMPVNGFPASVHWMNLLQRGLKVPPLAEACTVQTALMDALQSPKLMHSADYQAPLPYAYHLDAVKLGQLLKTTALSRGVRHVVGDVTAVRCGPCGIEAVELADGALHGADFFVDCTGFSSLLLGEALQVPWKSFGEWLPCDRAVACPVAHDSPKAPLRPYTTATAKAAGWTWEIDLQSRRGTGYVYASSHCSDDEAVATLLGHHAGARALAEPKLLRMRVGHFERPWSQNCLALGLAGGFIEPLESTAIYMIEFALQAFVDHVPPPGGAEACREAFNRTMAALYGELRDFVLAHYTLSMRRDTAFWRHVTRPDAQTESLRARLALWQHKLPSPTDLAQRLSLFGPSNWMFILAGLNCLPKHGVGHAAFIPVDVSIKAMEHVRGIREMATRQSPSMREFSHKIRAAHANRPAPA